MGWVGAIFTFSWIMVVGQFLGGRGSKEKVLGVGA